MSQVIVVNDNTNPVPVTVVGGGAGGSADTSMIGAKADAAAASDTGAFSLIALMKRGLQNWTTALGYLRSLVTNPAVVSGNITAATAAPGTVAGLTANSWIEIPAGVIDSVIARVASILGGPATATLAFYATDDDVNLYPLSGLPVGGTAGSGSFANTANAAGAWSLKGASARKVYLIATAIGAGTTVAAKLSATSNTSRLNAILRGSQGGSISAPAGSVPAEAVAIAYPGVTPTDRSGSIAAAGTAQVLMAANAARRGFWIQNLSTGDLWLTSLGNAAIGSPSLKVGPGELYEAPGGGVAVGAISIIGATLNQSFSAREW